MKKYVLSFLGLLSFYTIQAQVIFNVQAPAQFEGNYSLTYADDWGAVPDLTDPVNAVLDTLVMVNDGSAADSLGCLALTNSADIAGKIAVVYRGECQFGQKALNAQTAGAVAVVIINNVPGTPVGMAGGDFGAQVTIPVVMISQETGALLKDEIENGVVEAFIGNKLFLFDYDLGFFPQDVYLSNGMSIPSLIAQDGTEFNYTPALWLHNYGSESTVAAKVTFTISYGGNAIYEQELTGLEVLSGDELYVAGPNFAPASFLPGVYEVSMVVSYDENLALPDEIEEYPGDNSYSFNIVISDDQIFTRSSVDADGNMIAGGGLRTADGSAFSACVAFTHPNASRLAVGGLYFAASGAVDVPIEGELLGLTAWRMNADFVDINDANYAVDVTIIGSADFDIPSGTENGDILYSPILNGDGEPIVLEDNRRYVFCVGTDNPDIFIAFDGEGLDNRQQYEGLNGNAQPDYYIYTTGLGRFTDFYGLPSIGVEFFDANEVGIEESNQVDVTPYPNPTTAFLNIPLQNLNGKATLNVFDVAGKLVMSNDVNVQNNLLTVDVQDLPSGQYTFTIALENGKSSTFKVAIQK